MNADQTTDQQQAVPYPLTADTIITAVLAAIDLPNGLAVADIERRRLLLDQRCRVLATSLRYLTTADLARHGTPEEAADAADAEIEFLAANLAVWPVDYVTATDAVLYIGRSSSRCGACGGDADPTEQTHARRIGYRPGKGCATRWTAVQPESYGMDDDVRQMRPDLKFLPAGTTTPAAGSESAR